MIKKKILLYTSLITLVIIYSSTSFAASEDDQPQVSIDDLIIIFGLSSIVVLGIFIYLARDVILRKKTPYDNSEFESRQNRDKEKYQSDWADDYKEIGEQSSRYNEIENKNYYEILGMEKNATQKEIKQKYRMLAKQLHPDKNTDEKSSEKMIQINEAYKILSDKNLRKMYDKKNTSFD